MNNQTLKRLKSGNTNSLKNFGMRGENPMSLAKSFSKLRNLEKHDLAANNHTQFPTGIRGNKGLKEMLLSNNNLTLDDRNMEIAPALEKLELQKNKIRMIPPCQVLDFLI